MKAKRILLIGALSVISFSGNAQALTHIHDWTLSRGDDGYESGESIVVADDGNVYSTGVFEQSVDFGEPGSPSIKTSNGARDVYVAKHDENGYLIWARSFGGSSSETVVAIDVDSESNVYITGRFHGTVDFNPSPFGTFTLTQTGGIFRDVYISKFNQSGMFIWAKKLDGTNELESTDIALDVYNNVHVTGSFSSQLDVDPSSGTNLLTSAGSGDQDGFCVTLDQYGVYDKSYHLEGSQSDVSINAVTLDPFRNQYFTGELVGTCDFDVDTPVASKTSIGFGSDAFIMSVDPWTGFRWVELLESSVDAHPKSIKVDANKDVYSVGTFSGTIDLQPLSGIHTDLHVTSNLRTSVYVSKLSYNGQYLYGKSIVGTGPMSTRGNVYGEDLHVTAGGSAYLTGSFTKNVDFRSGPGTSIISAVGTEDAFICGLGTSGNLMTLKTIESHYSYGVAKSNAIALSGSNDIYTTGRFTEMADFNPSGYPHYEISLGGYDMFIHKLELYQPPVTGTFWKSNAGVNEEKGFDVEVYPNPTANFINLSVSGEEGVKVSIHSISGKLVCSGEFNAGLSSVSLANVSVGTYILQVTQGENTERIKVVKK